MTNILFPHKYLAELLRIYPYQLLRHTISYPRQKRFPFHHLKRSHYLPHHTGWQPMTILSFPENTYIHLLTKKPDALQQPGQIPPTHKVFHLVPRKQVVLWVHPEYLFLFSILQTNPTDQACTWPRMECHLHFHRQYIVNVLLMHLPYYP